MTDCYEYEMNNDVQQELELNLLRAFCLQKELGKILELKEEATEREMLKLGAVRYRVCCSSVCGALCY
jgi:hypothetical protein